MSKKAMAERRLEVVYRDPFDLKPDPRNARTHSPEQIEQLRASIREFGFTNPVLLRPDGMIGAGHGRVEAAKAEKLALVPTCVVEGLTDDQWRAYVLADNKLALNAGWDEDLLREELRALTELEVDLSGLGFDGDELADLFKTVEALGDMPALSSDDRQPFQQITFTVHDDQADIVRRAMTLAGAEGPYTDGLNENGNGNALARISHDYVARRALG